MDESLKYYARRKIPDAEDYRCIIPFCETIEDKATGYLMVAWIQARERIHCRGLWENM